MCGAIAAKSCPHVTFNFVFGRSSPVAFVLARKLEGVVEPSQAFDCRVQGLQLILEFLYALLKFLIELSRFVQLVEYLGARQAGPPEPSRWRDGL